MDYLELAREISDELYETRRCLHRCPEPGNREYRTSAFIKEYLASCGIEVHELLDTAVVGVLRGKKPGKTAALRADMDALPMSEATGADFASENEGYMHACGHDVHVASALGAAKLLSAMREELPGTVVFLFQPDEEGSGGADRMAKLGCMDGVDAVFGGHVTPDLPLGCIGVRYGKFYAASDVFHIEVHGKSAHAATPEKGTDALYAAAMLACRLKGLPALIENERSVVTVGMLSAGTAGNILAGQAEMRGIIRTLGYDTRSRMKNMLYEAARSVSDETGALMDIHIRESYPGVVNNDSMTAHAERTAKSVFGQERVSIISEPTMTTEDFGYLLDRAPGTFYHVGAGCSLPLHNPGFLPQEEAVLNMTAMHTAVIMNYLTENR